MLTPAQRHFQTIMAERRGTTDNPMHGSAYDQQLHRLRIDQRRLAQFQSYITRATMKREMLPAYAGWLDGVLNADTGQRDEIVTTCMIWFIDAGLYRDAMRLAEYVIRHNLPLPDRYKRNAACTLVDEMAGAALLSFKLATSTNPPPEIDILLHLHELTAEQDMPDEARAKLFKVIGYTLRESSHHAAALIWLQRALAAHKDSGVKKDIEVLDRNLKKAALLATQEQNESGSNGSIDAAAKSEPVIAPTDQPTASTKAPAKNQSATAARKSAARCKTNKVRNNRTT